MRSLGTGSGVLLAMFCLFTANVQGKETYGWIEHARVESLDIEAKAKLDSGALTSSIHATDIERFERDDEEWVRFTLALEKNDKGEMKTKRLERPLFRDLTVIGAGGRDTRPVVLLEICFGDTVYEEQFGLENRDDLTYPLLIGRRTIQHLGTIDVTKTFLKEPVCDGDSERLSYEEQDSDEDIGI
ncbi:hypothetical protein J2T55_002303 [Methylohalomonas lacus]|uniref:Retropepsin-like aspartic endopeptidase domain-containing protein n=1 Tax=Methylohalomonas lacus TaxID=398773 RepID=A0AAE3HN32_9GAMM|nr:ATP-dependent zinc protease [Methylohalomonas lacus]MCS3904267.1 hypothetical protein [Methylohalomonas lacus]